MVVERFIKEDFQQVRNEKCLRGNTFMVDKQCGDLIAFPNERRQYIEDHPLLFKGHLVLQVATLNVIMCNVHVRVMPDKTSIGSWVYRMRVPNNCVLYFYSSTPKITLINTYRSVSDHEMYAPLFLIFIKLNSSNVFVIMLHSYLSAFRINRVVSVPSRCDT